MTTNSPNNNLTFQVQLEEMLLVGIGAVPGALLRWLLSVYLVDQNLLVNVGGAALLGLLAGSPSAPKRQLLLGVGFCGSVTTFSSWMLDSVKLIAIGAWGQALGLIGFTLGLGLGAAALGFQMGKWLRPSERPQSRS